MVICQFNALLLLFLMIILIWCTVHIMSFNTIIFYFNLQRDQCLHYVKYNFFFFIKILTNYFFFSYVTCIFCLWCMHVTVCVCIFVYLCIFLCRSMCVCMYMHVCVCVCAYSQSYTKKYTLWKVPKKRRKERKKCAKAE